MPASSWCASDSSLAGARAIWTRRERELAPFIAELDVPVGDPGVPGEFFLGNANFEAVDAELLYGIVRAMRPARVIELGSG